MRSSPGLGGEAFYEAGLVLHGFEPGLHQLAVSALAGPWR